MLTKQEIRQLKDSELQEEIKKTSAELIKAKMEILNGYSKESHKAINMRRYLALLKTVETENRKADSKKKA